MWFRWAVHWLAFFSSFISISEIVSSFFFCLFFIYLFIYLFIPSFFLFFFDSAVSLFDVIQSEIPATGQLKITTKRFNKEMINQSNSFFFLFCLKQPWNSDACRRNSARRWRMKCATTERRWRPSRPRHRPTAPSSTTNNPPPPINLLPTPEGNHIIQYFWPVTKQFEQEPKKKNE